MMNAIRLTKKTASTIQEVAGIALENIPMTFSNSDLSPGRKVFFPIPMKKKPKNMTDFLYVFAESKLAGPPKNPSSGFTEEDVEDQVGVYLFKMEGETVNGCTYSIDTFLIEVIKDFSLRNRLIYRVNDMRNMIHLDDNFLDLANSEWRASKSPESFGIKRLH
jgi:hypothetical protein